MCTVGKGAYHGPAPIPEEGKWVQVKQISDVSASLTETFAKNGLTVEPGAVDNMAANIVENYAGSDELTEEQFNDIMLNYYQANKDSIENTIQ